MRILRFITIMLTAFSLSAAFAHLLEMPAKLTMTALCGFTSCKLSTPLLVGSRAFAKSGRLSPLWCSLLLSARAHRHFVGRCSAHHRHFLDLGRPGERCAGTTVTRDAASGLGAFAGPVGVRPRFTRHSSDCRACYLGDFYSCWTFTEGTLS